VLRSLPLLLLPLMLGQTHITWAHSVDCKAERVALLSSIQPIVHPDAAADAKEDSDPSTVEFFFVKDLPQNKARVSENGQALYVPEGGGDDMARAELFAIALDRQLALKVGSNVCPPLHIPKAGT
jgi:hypothetical protein